VITDRNTLSVDVEYVIDANGTKTVLVVETDLQLDPPEINFDKAAVDALCSDLERHRASNPYVRCASSAANLRSCRVRQR
jgi:hypothetical protein